MDIDERRNVNFKTTTNTVSRLESREHKSIRVLIVLSASTDKAVVSLSASFSSTASMVMFVGVIFWRLIIW